LARSSLGSLYLSKETCFSSPANCDSLTCDYLGRKWAIVATTLMIVIGGILATASNGYTINGMFWMLTIARGIVGFGESGLVQSRHIFLRV
jgi:MFS family permease